MSDQISNLPFHYAQPSPQDLKVVEAMFGSSGSSTSSSLLAIIISGAVFFGLNLPIVDKFIKGYVTASDLVILGTKTLIYIVILVLLKLFGLV